MKLMSNCSPVGACALELYSVRNVAATNTGRQDALSAGDFVTLGGATAAARSPGPSGRSLAAPGRRTADRHAAARSSASRDFARRRASRSFCFGKARDSRAGPDLVLTIPARQGPAGLLCAAGLGPFVPNTMTATDRAPFTPVGGVQGPS